MKKKNITERMEELNEMNETILREQVEPTIVVGYDLAEGTDRNEQFNAKISEHLEKFHPSPSDLRAILIPKFTVRGEHNVWHVYENDERLEPPFRNQERAEIERCHHERCHAIRKGYNQTPNQGV